MTITRFPSAFRPHTHSRSCSRWRAERRLRAVFTGRSWLAPVSGEQVSMANVTFEPGCINHWHIHHATKGGGQMLICVGGRGYAQIEGQEPIAMTPGTVVHIPANTKHWHGAAPGSWFSHIAIDVPGEGKSNDWLEPVDEAFYRSLK